MKSKEFPLEGLPATARELVDALDRLFPPRCIRLNESLHEAQRYAGSRDVVEYLITVRDRQDRRSTPKV